MNAEKIVNKIKDLSESLSDLIKTTDNIKYLNLIILFLVFEVENTILKINDKKVFENTVRIMLHNVESSLTNVSNLSDNSCPTCDSD